MKAITSHVMNGIGTVHVGYETFFVDKIHHLLVKFCIVEIFLMDTFKNYFEDCTPYKVHIYIVSHQSFPKSACEMAVNICY